jgi:hypothetical protein
VKWPSAWELVVTELNWKGAAIHRGFEPRSRGLATVRSCSQAAPGEDTAGLKRCKVLKSAVAL